MCRKWLPALLIKNYVAGPRCTRKNPSPSVPRPSTDLAVPSRSSVGASRVPAEAPGWRGGPPPRIRGESFGWSLRFHGGGLMSLLQGMENPNRHSLGCLAFRGPLPEPFCNQGYVCSLPPKPQDVTATLNFPLANFVAHRNTKPLRWRLSIQIPEYSMPTGRHPPHRELGSHLAHSSPEFAHAREVDHGG